MAGNASVTTSLQIDGLDSDANVNLSVSFTGTVPTGVTHEHRALASNTSEALDLGDVATINGILFKAVSKDFTIDTTYVDAYVAEISVPEGETAYFAPSGTVHVKNIDEADAGTYSYIVFGTV